MSLSDLFEQLVEPITPYKPFCERVRDAVVELTGKGYTFLPTIMRETYGGEHPEKIYTTAANKISGRMVGTDRLVDDIVYAIQKYDLPYYMGRKDVKTATGKTGRLVIYHKDYKGPFWSDGRTS